MSEICIQSDKVTSLLAMLLMTDLLVENPESLVISSCDSST